MRFNTGDESIDELFQSYHNNSANNNPTNVGSGVGGGGGGGGGGPSCISGTNVTSCTTAIASGIGHGGEALSTSPSQHQQNPIVNVSTLPTNIINILRIALKALKAGNF